MIKKFKEIKRKQKVVVSVIMKTTVGNVKKRANEVFKLGGHDRPL